jgi:ribosomal protein S18 acetylase RimI-like enzyme
MIPAADSPQIGPVPFEGAAESLALVFCQLATEERTQQVQTLLTHARSRRTSLEGLLGAYRGDRLTGAQFAQLLPGKAALVWPPRLVEGEPEDTACRLLDAACRWLAGRGARVAHALLESVTEADDRVLRAGGFDPLTDLLYLVALESQFPVSPPASPLEFEPYDAANHDRLLRVVEATYEQTLDCPQLNDVRSIEEILEGYRGTGTYDPSRWLLVRQAGRDVGCLLLADHPEHANWELVYMGLAVSARGHGWGMDIARHGQWLTRLAGRPRMVLAVDAENSPAIEMYSAVGFRAWDRRSVYGKVFRP